MAITFIDEEKKVNEMYRIGDTFVWDKKIPGILILTDNLMVAMVMLDEDGFVWTDAKRVENSHAITKEEFDAICGGGSEAFERVDLEIRVKR